MPDNNFFSIGRADNSNIYQGSKVESYNINNYHSNSKVKESALQNSEGKVFIIHGHNEGKWRELEKILKEEFSLKPIILSEQPDMGYTIIEKFEHYAKTCEYAFAIFTPDDIIDGASGRYFQARPNVIFEIGWFYARLGREKVCILLEDGKGIEVFSDLQGVMQKRFQKSIKELYKDIETELKSVGII